MPATATPPKSKKSNVSTFPALSNIPPGGNTAPTTMKVINIGVDDIEVTRDNHRRQEGEAYKEGIHELAASIAADGLQVPIKVWLKSDKTGVLIYGHRRLDAVKLLKWQTVPAIEGTEEEARAARVIENLQRLELNPIEESIAVADLMSEAELDERRNRGLSDTGAVSASVENEIRYKATQAVAQRLGRSVVWVRDRNFLGTLDKTTRELVIGGRLPMEHARELAKIADPDKRSELAGRASLGGKLHERSYRKNEAPMLMRELRAEVAKHIRSLAQVAWPLDKEFAGAPACTNCPANSRNQTGLFEDGKVQWGTSTYDHSTSKEPEAGVCTNAACYGRKSGASSRAISTGAKRVTATVNGLPVKERGDKAVAAAVAQHQPAIVTPAAFKRAVKEHRERYAAAAKNKPKSGSSSAPAKRAKTAESVADDKHREAVRAWIDKVRTPLRRAIAKRPLVWLLLDYLTRTDLVDQAAGSEYRKVKADTKARDRLAGLVKVALRADSAAADQALAIETILAERLRDCWVEEYQFDEAGVLEIILDELTPKRPKRPVLEDFLPKAKPEAKESKKPAAAVASSCGECGRKMKPGQGETVEGVLLCDRCIGGGE